MDPDVEVLKEVGLWRDGEVSGVGGGAEVEQPT